MKNNLSNVFKNVSLSDMNNFLNKTNPELEVKETLNNNVDYTWISKIEKTLPNIENIINNVDNKNIDEEFTFRYENRFIYTLINILERFITKKLTIIKKSSLNKDEKVIKYKANTRYNNKDVKIDLKLECAGLQDDEISKLDSKIIEIKDKINSFKTSNFMKVMLNSTLVRSPIRKTKLFTSDHNYLKCLELWEYLENYQNEVIEDNLNSKIIENKSDFDLIYYLAYSLLNKKVDNKDDLFIDLLLDYAKRYDVDEVEIQKKLLKELTTISEKKKKDEKIITLAYQNFIKEHDKKMQKGKSLFK